MNRPTRASARPAGAGRSSGEARPAPWLIASALTLTACGGASDQMISFEAAPTLVLHDTVTVTATSNSGLPVTFSSLTPAVCTVEATTGTVTTLTAGACTIAADQAGDATHHSAPQVTQTLTVKPASQHLTFGTTPSLAWHGNATVIATASSGLPATFGTTTPSVCSVSATGHVTDLALGTCTVTADQAGDSSYEPAPRALLDLVVDRATQAIAFSAAPTLVLHGTATVSATSSSGLPVTYGTTSPAVCTVDVSSGKVTDLTVGTCLITADQAGDTEHHPAPQAAQTLVVSEPAAPPSAPSALVATIGVTPTTVLVTFTAPSTPGGSPISTYTVVSDPPGVSASGTTSPITVHCEPSCAGLAFGVYATNDAGAGERAPAVHVLASYDVVETFREPDCAPNDTIFTGTFAFDFTTNEVLDLRGSLTESMTPEPMATVPLTHQLSSQSDGAGGVLVTTFLLDTKDTFYGGGFAPGSGGAIYYGFPSAPNPGKPGGVGNAYAMIDVQLADPTTPATQRQLNLLAYADCTPLGMMGAACMTGTTVAGYGTIGSMNGYPVSQTITRR